jgi:hypothetical protein
MSKLADRLQRDGPGNIQFVMFNPSELSFWAAVAKQNLFVRLVGRRWYVTDIEWGNERGGFIGWVKMRSVLETT